MYTKNPKYIFLIDAIGALVSSCMLGIVLVKFESFFGIPLTTLYILASIPIFFIGYDLYSYSKDINIIKKHLKIIALMNILYCILSIGLAIYHYQLITYWGWAYIIIEIILVVSIAMIELKIANNIFDS